MKTLAPRCRGADKPIIGKCSRSGIGPYTTDGPTVVAADGGEQ